MGIKTVPHPPYSPDFAPCDFCLFPNLRSCRYETIEEMKEAVTKVIDTLTEEDFHGALQKLLERYNKCIRAGRDYFEGDLSFMCLLSIKCPYEKCLETYLIILVHLEDALDYIINDVNLRFLGVSGLSISYSWCRSNTSLWQGNGPYGINSNLLRFFFFDVAQDRMTRISDKTRSHLCSFECPAW